MKIEAIIFDLGNVFINVEQGKALHRLHSHRDETTDFIQDAAAAERLIHSFERGELTTPQFHEAVCRQGRYALELNRFCAIYCDIFAPVDEMIEANAALRRAGLRTYIFSNTSGLHFDHIRRSYPFMSEFTGYFLSYELGCMKPDAPAYDAVEKGTGCSGGALLYIDDRPENVEAGAARGWNTIHHNDPRVTVASLRTMGLL
jgi:2-haloacid dehalogenase